MATITNLTAVLSMNNTKFKKGLSGSQTAMKGFQKQMIAVGGLIAASFSVAAIGRFTKESIKLAATMQGVERAFNNLGRPGFLNELQQATRGTVDNLKLMQLAVQAKNFKIPLEKLAGYFEFATSRAIQTGESVDYLVDSIIKGIGRKSVLVMDNLGISAAELQEEVKKVGDFGLAAGNIIEKALQDAGRAADTTATKIARVSTAWTNLKLVVGERLSEGFMARGLGAALERWTKILGDTSGSAGMKSFMEFFETISDKSKADQIAAVATRIETIRKSIEYYAGKYKNYDKLAEESRGKEKKSYEESKESIYDINQSNVALLRIYEQQLVALKANNKAISESLPEILKPDKWEGLSEIENNFYKPGGVGMKMLDWTTDPKITDGMKAISNMIEHMDEQTMEWLENMDEDFKSEVFPNIEKIDSSLKGLGNTIGVILVTQFDALGEAIGRSLRGAEADLKSLALAIIENLGYMLIMAGFELMKTNPKIGLALIGVGATIQLGSGIAKGLTGGRVDSSAVSTTPNYNHQVNFKISGRDLEGVLNLAGNYG